MNNHMYFYVSVCAENIYSLHAQQNFKHIPVLLTVLGFYLCYCACQDFFHLCIMLYDMNNFLCHLYICFYMYSYVSRIRNIKNKILTLHIQGLKSLGTRLGYRGRLLKKGKSRISKGRKSYKSSFSKRILCLSYPEV